MPMNGAASARNKPKKQTEEKRAPVIRSPLFLPGTSRLLERAVDRSELRVQRGAQAVDGGDDRERNAGRDQAVFDRGGARLVLHETSNQVLHKLTPCTRGCRTKIWSWRSQHRDHGRHRME